GQPGAERAGYSPCRGRATGRWPCCGRGCTTCPQRHRPGASEGRSGQMRVGFVGLGAMGSRMAANLQKSGCQLVVFNRTRDKAASLVSEGATWADTPAAVGEQVEVLFTMLAHPAAVRETALGKGGFMGRL